MYFGKRRCASFDTNGWVKRAGILLPGCIKLLCFSGCVSFLYVMPSAGPGKGVDVILPTYVAAGGNFSPQDRGRVFFGNETLSTRVAAGGNFMT